MELVSRRRPARHVTLTPLIDVVFILLVFFMLQTNFLRPAALELGMPGQASGEGGGPAPISIEIHDDGALWFDGSRIAFEDLRGRLAARTPGPDTRVVLASDHAVPLQTIVGLLDVLHGQNLTRVSLVKARRFDAEFRP